jgi:hypothetical protein
MKEAMVKEQNSNKRQLSNPKPRHNGLSDLRIRLLRFVCDLSIAS